MIAQTEVPDDVVKEVRNCLQEEVSKGAHSYKIEASMGFARWDGNPESFKESMISADKKMYEDKRLA
jgi:PleD family two-component response regulator